ncbi:P-loop NTPase fold protein [Pseudomonas alliivorans]|nr:P-loop NTPase fold protein [Pseudomonas alliivorans]MEE4703801.1 P-loop NTPase fold protein [Pseudomonas alliivorans]MEE4739775.1 P-loop NTPase fold protein [Pseudomonas alliivorans]
MKLKNSALEIPPNDIFKHDQLSRRNSVKNLAVLLKNVSSPLVLSVNAPWGAGKTTFLKMLRTTLSSSPAKSVYFSAWETDFAVDPLLAFIGEMNVELCKYIDGDKEKSKAWGAAKAAGAQILRRGIPVGVKIATAGILDLEKLVEDEASKLSEALAKDIIDNYSKDKEAIAVFKANVAKVLGAGAVTQEKMFIFVDELDRCRPDYAIELLERIKHLLDIEGLVFVLALDKDQLAHSVKAVYGSEFDALGYLKRFIDVEFTLPSANVDQFVEHLLSNLELNQYFAMRVSREVAYDRSSLVEMLKVVAKNMSLRNIEQLLAKIKLVSLSVKPNQYFYPEFVVFLLFVKDAHNHVYINFSRPQSGGDELISLLGKIVPTAEFGWTRQYLEGLIIAGKLGIATEWAEGRVKSLKEIYQSSNSSDEEKANAGRILEVVNSSTRMGRGFPLDIVLERIDMLSDFEFN